MTNKSNPAERLFVFLNTMHGFVKKSPQNGAKATLEDALSANYGIDKNDFAEILNFIVGLVEQASLIRSYEDRLKKPNPLIKATGSYYYQQLQRLQPKYNMGAFAQHFMDVDRLQKLETCSHIFELSELEVGSPSAEELDKLYQMVIELEGIVSNSSLPNELKYELLPLIDKLRVKFRAAKIVGVDGLADIYHETIGKTLSLQDQALEADDDGCADAFQSIENFIGQFHKLIETTEKAKALAAPVIDVVSTVGAGLLTLGKNLN